MITYYNCSLWSSVSINMSLFTFKAVRYIIWKSYRTNIYTLPWCDILYDGNTKLWYTHFYGVVYWMLVMPYKQIHTTMVWHIVLMSYLTKIHKIWLCSIFYKSHTIQTYIYTTMAWYILYESYITQTYTHFCCVVYCTLVIPYKTYALTWSVILYRSHTVQMNTPYHSVVYCMEVIWY